MSAAAAAVEAKPDAQEAAPKTGKKKKLLIILLAVVVLLAAGGGGGAWWLMKKKAAQAAAAEEEADVAESQQATGKHGATPTFVKLDPFTVNLADKDADRYVQLSIELQIEDPKLSDKFKVLMPAVRDAVLMILSSKTSQELLSKEGKETLKHEIIDGVSAALGYHRPVAEEDADASKKKKKPKPLEPPPVTEVYFVNFIVQ